MTDCIFCKIVSKEIPSEIVFEDEHTMAFLDIRPVAKGHTLVIPKQHFRDILDTDDGVLAEVIVTCKKVGKAIMEATGAQGYNTGSNNGAAAGQEVFHMHFHLIPRHNKDGLKTWTHHESEPAARVELAEKIRALI